MILQPELNKYMDKRVRVVVNGGRVVEGTMRGFDVFLNVTLSEAAMVRGERQVALGTAVVRGNLIVSTELLGTAV